MYWQPKRRKRALDSDTYLETEDQNQLSSIIDRLRCPDPDDEPRVYAKQGMPFGSTTAEPNRKRKKKQVSSDFKGTNQLVASFWKDREAQREDDELE